jgi:hypothetical protein
MRKGILLVAAFMIAGGGAQAAVTKFEVQSRKPFSSNPRFELLEGRFTGALDPADRYNAIINDIGLAPHDSSGRVVYSATFKLLKPLDMTGASGLLIYDVPNRGHGAVTAFPQGHVSVISGWQGDLADGPALQTITVPVAHNRDGSPILGPVIARFIDMPAGTTTMPIAGGPAGGIGGHNFLPATERGARLIKASSDTAEPVEVPRGDWAFGDCTSAAFPGKADLGKLCLKNGFDPKFAYTLSFQAQDPRLLSIGFAATRDLIAFLRYAKTDDAGNPNPVAGQMRWAIARGVSQSGNYLRSFLHLGFNAAENGRIVFDGVNPLIAARQNPMNFRFANPGGAANLYEPGSDGVVWWTGYADKTRGLPEASLLDRCHATATCPKIVEELGSSEFWGLRASPDFVGTDAKADLPLPASVRRYYTPGVTHGGGRGGFALTSGTAPGCILPANPNPAFDTYNAIFDTLVQWVTHDVPPPPSSYPTLATGDLVAPTAAAMGFPTIAGQPTPDGHLNALLQYDFGPGFNAADLSGAIAVQPPHIVRTLPSLVPRTDTDGNEIAGIRSVLMQVPLGTYLGWNVTAKGFEAGQGCGFQGGYIPFAATKAERLANRDPRLSLEERYRTHANYVAKVKAAASRLVANRYLLPGDAARLVMEAENSDILDAQLEHGQR